MKSITNIIKKYYFLVIPFVVTVFMLFQQISFDIVDDSFMMEIANSYKYNSRSEHLVFISVFYGYIIKFLNNTIPFLNWFSIMYILIVNLAFVPLYYMTQKYDNKVMFVIIIAVLQAWTFLHITFTVIPFLCSASSVLWILEHVKKLDRYSIKHLVFSFVLFFLGFAMRSGSTFVCIFLLIMPILLCSVIEKRNTFKVVISIMILCIVANYSVIAIRYAYEKNIPEETYFNQFAEYRSVLSDGTEIFYEENREAFQTIGITENDMQMYRSFEYADKSVFSNENLREIVQMRSFKDKYTLKIWHVIYWIDSVFLLFGYLCIAFVCFIFFKKRRKEIFLFSCFVVGAVSFLFIRERAFTRIVRHIILFGLTIITYIGMQELTYSVKLGNILRKILTIMLSIIFVSVNITNICYNKEANQPSSHNVVIDFVEKNSDKIYVTDEVLNGAISPRSLSIKALKNSNPQPYNIFGDWFVYSYYWYSRLDQLGLSEYQDCTFKAVLDDNVRVVSKNSEFLNRVCTFLEEHYNIKSDYFIEEVIGNTGYFVYNFDIVE